MRAANIRFILFALLVAAGCTNEQLNASIEHMNVGIQAYQTSSPAAAVEHFAEAAKVYPENHVAWYYLGQSQQEQENWDAASEAFSQAVKLMPGNAMYQMFLGISLYHAGKQSMASSYLEKAIELEPKLYRAHWYLGALYNDSDRPEQAAQAWAQAATLNPDWGRPFVSLGKLYLTWDMIPEAIAVLEQGQQHSQGEHLPNIYYYLGLSYDAQKNWDKSISAYSSAIDKSREVNKDNVEAKFQRGLAYIQKGDKSKAQADLEEVSKASSDPFTKQEANKLLMLLVAAE